MFDSLDAFASQFTPVEDGYLYYPSKKSGGKLVTVDEYHELVEGWRKVAGRAGMLKVVGIVMLTIFAWTIFSETRSLPDWSNSIFIAVTITSICAWIFWGSFAPRRLVRDRLEAAPPKSRSQIRRETLTMVNWRLVILALLVSGLVFVATLYSTERSFGSWAWLVGSGALFSSYIWLAVQKFWQR